MGLPFISDSSIVLEWTNNNYNTGLFGSTRRSIGAFYFELNIVQSQPVATIMIPITSRKAYMLGSKTVNDINESSLLITDYKGRSDYQDVLQSNT